MNPIVLQDMTAQDVPAAAALDGTRWSEGSFRAELSKPVSRCRVARAGGELVAFLVAWHLPGESQVAELAVHPDFRRRGVARRLLEEFLEESRRRGAGTATLEVRAGNDAALKLYGSLGFAVTGRRPTYYEGREDAVLMEKKC